MTIMSPQNPKTLNPKFPTSWAEKLHRFSVLFLLMIINAFFKTCKLKKREKKFTILVTIKFILFTITTKKKIKKKKKKKHLLVG